MGAINFKDLEKLVKIVAMSADLPVKIDGCTPRFYIGQSHKGFHWTISLRRLKGGVEVMERRICGKAAHETAEDCRKEGLMEYIDICQNGVKEDGARHFSFNIKEDT